MLYEFIVRRTFQMVLPGARIFVKPSPQASTCPNSFGYVVGFPTNDTLAEAFFGPRWDVLTEALRLQVICYLAGHEAAHAWEHRQGFTEVPGDALRVLLGRILADMRVDHLPVLSRITNWSVNRDLACQTMVEPMGQPADSPATGAPYRDAVLLLDWCLLVMRCRRLRLDDARITTSPVATEFQEVWGQLASIIVGTHLSDWSAEATFIEAVLDVLFGWVRQREQHLQLFPRTTTKEEFEQRLDEVLNQTQRPTRCLRLSEISSDTMLSAILSQLEGTPLMRRAITQHRRERTSLRRAWSRTVEKTETWSPSPNARDIRKVLQIDTAVVPVLASQLTEVLRPLLYGQAWRRQPHSDGPVLDLRHQASRVYLNAHHAMEWSPRIWLRRRPLPPQITRLKCVLLVDCSGSMAEVVGNTRPAVSAYLAGAALIGAVDSMTDRAELSVAGFTEEVLPVREFESQMTAEQSQKVLAQAQALKGGTELTPALNWAFDQFSDLGGNPSEQRLLVVVTDACLDDDDPHDLREAISEHPDVHTVVIGVGDVTLGDLLDISPRAMTLPSNLTHQLPTRLHQVVEDIVRQRELTG
ncbi:uncharacterized protein with von Willebrand factor type A (vWA) domain [Crossiella equi]|uniref:Uncharacterized protein with von Willebrand factor type A (VWA) domain n=1 Tax=Crossiella equi TaxID=130796 RepID=A0ABS5A5Z3_9PSEU|nr:vWA domain-containing protein [Crossiella equi]MBP2471145.1 uncharacterized protein with von Willebrand factor type A (vWA) domain [Crossiella equi]